LSPSSSLAAIDSTHESHEVRTPSVKPGAHDDPDPQIQFSKEHGIIEVRDRRLFRRGHEAFCRRLVESAARQPGIRSASVALGSGTCRLEFGGARRSEAKMARRFVEIVNEALSEPAIEETPGKPETEWATLLAFPAGEIVSCWQVSHDAVDRLRIQNAILHLDASLARRVARALREIPGIDSCAVDSFRRELRIAYDPSQRAALGVVEAAETCLQRLFRPCLPPTDPDDSRHSERTDGQSQPWFLALAAGSSAIAGLGVIVPGIPTLLFLLAAGFCVFRWSPRLKRKLRRSQRFGPILEKIERLVRTSLHWKMLFISGLACLTEIVVWLVLPSPSLVPLSAAAAALGVLLILRMPDSASRSTSTRGRTAPRRLSMAAAS
jgi:uncharacterized membrane protein YbaN (DUF454 family)